MKKKKRYNAFKFQKMVCGPNEHCCATFTGLSHCNSKPLLPKRQLTPCAVAAQDSQDELFDNSACEGMQLIPFHSA